MGKIEEMIAARQAPGITIRKPIRSALMRDAAGKEVRVLYAGQEDTGSVEKDLIGHAEHDGLDLASAKVQLTEEMGQGLGKKGNKRAARKRKRK